MALPSSLDPGSGFAGLVDPNAYGTTDFTVFSVPAFSFSPLNGSTVAWAWFDGKYTSAGSDYFTAGLQLPTGVSLQAFELEACDSSNTAQVRLRLMSCPAPPGSFCTVIGTVETGVAEVPGCSRFYQALATPHTVNNLNNSYAFEVLTGSGTSATRIRAARIGYVRQISPAPVTATFNDVSNAHPFYQHIEALVASGITGGCGGGNYCPNDPVTRGQMAVFLAKALGLHWIQ